MYNIYRMSVYRYAGVWNSATTYYTNFMVVSNNLAYVAKETVTGGGDPSTNLAQWTYLPAGPQVAATFPIIDGNVSLSVDGNSDLVITAGASNVLVNSPLLVDTLNNSSNSPAPSNGNVLTWNGSNIAWGAGGASSFPLQNNDATISLSIVGDNLVVKNEGANGAVFINPQSNGATFIGNSNDYSITGSFLAVDNSSGVVSSNFVSLGGTGSAVRIGDVDGKDFPWMTLNDAQQASPIAGASNIILANPVGDFYASAQKLKFFINGATAPNDGDTFTWKSSADSAAWTPKLLSGKFIANSSSTNVILSIPGMTSTGLVSLTYVHAGGGGGSQYFKTVTPTTDSVSIDLNTVTDIGDSIIWGVLKYL